MRTTIKIKITLICIILYSTASRLAIAFATQSIASHESPLSQSRVTVAADEIGSSELYHTTNALISEIRRLCSRCPHADAEWTVVTPAISTTTTKNDESNIDPQMNLMNDGGRPRNAILTVTLTRNAKARNAARRRGKEVSNRTSIVATFGEHGRELITSELALQIIARICESKTAALLDNNDDDDADEDGQEGNVDGVDMDRYEFVLVPLVNENGRRAVESGDFCRRLNGHAVDLNRNYKHMWGVTDSATVHEEEQAGKSPLSEYETRAVDAVVQRFRPAGYISVHSGATAVLHPWDSGVRDRDTSPVGSWLRAAAYTLARAHCGACATGSAASTFGYRAYGTGVDHMLAERGIPLALTVEIFGSDDSDCHAMFNPVSQHDFNQVITNWSSFLSTTSHILTLYPSFSAQTSNTIHKPSLTQLLNKAHGLRGRVKTHLDNPIKEVLIVNEDNKSDAYCVHWIADDSHFPNAASLSQ